MKAPNWIARKVSILLPHSASVQDGRAKSAGNSPARQAAPAPAAPVDKPVHPAVPSAVPSAKPRAVSVGVLRTTHERLAAMLRHGEEALSPRMLRRTLNALQAVVDPRVSEVEGGIRAKAVARWYGGAPLVQRRDMWLLMSECFVSDPQTVQRAQADYAAAVGTADEAAAQVHYRRATVSPRRRLLQRFSAFPEGIRFLVDLRAEMLAHLKSDKRLQALDVEMEYMFSTWFDVGFLDLRRLSWDSPASLIEKLIRYEAVHDIVSWADVKNRLDSDRRCYGFFHPRLPDEPLIFVEVALADAIADSMAPLLDESATPSDLNKATTAIFYSISNTQPGLRGVSFGDSLIKRVVESLKAEFPRLKTFATLSPIPGFRGWLSKNAVDTLARFDGSERAALGRAFGNSAFGAEQMMQAADRAAELDVKSPLRKMLLRSAALYLSSLTPDGKPLDGVARFHLGNGARIERLNWCADGSAKGRRQSFGLMVNYLYDPKRLDRNRALLAQGKIPVSAEIESLAL